MKTLVAATLVIMASGASAQSLKQQFPSCDVKTQRALKGNLAGDITDPRQAHILMRTNILQADLGNASKAGRLTKTTANQLFKRVETVKTDTNRYTKRQKFLSAGEAASYDRTLDAVAIKVCRR